MFVSHRDIKHLFQNFSLLQIGFPSFTSMIGICRGFSDELLLGEDVAIYPADNDKQTRIREHSRHVQAKAIKSYIAG
jgi:hypothetical protein